jgi:hypothetical protein
MHIVRPVHPWGICARLELTYPIDSGACGGRARGLVVTDTGLDAHTTNTHARRATQLDETHACLHSQCVCERGTIDSRVERDKAHSSQSARKKHHQSYTFLLWECGEYVHVFTTMDMLVKNTHCT